MSGMGILARSSSIVFTSSSVGGAVSPYTISQWKIWVKVGFCSSTQPTIKL
ncbi:hypothetical protein [Dulcicalothrix desertica]|uniref:hypothetical protein n=1 Tax=Dulcicalothrix desertica TaxID=32056 RepID=UPI001647D96B|nr:hypothetical protein [Dulcicalothrix desertica]